MVDSSGEIVPIAGLTDEELVNYTPLSPGEIEVIIRVLSDRLEAATPALKQMWEDRYEAERNMIQAHATAVLNSKRGMAMEKKAEADIAALPYRLDFDLKKAILHGAEQLQKALQAKLFGYLNLSKAMTAAYHGQTFDPRR